MAEVGYVALFLALAGSLYSAIAYMFAGGKTPPAQPRNARRGLLFAAALVTVAELALAIAIITHQFQIDYVYAYSSRDSSLPYLISALWAGNDGSLLFWAWLLAVFAVIVVLQKRDRNRELVPYAAGVMMFAQAFFLLLLVTVCNPFHQLTFTPADGLGLNPMLQNPGMIIHPPLLLAGYVGFTVPFAFAVAALLKRKLGSDWLAGVRRWTLVAWLALGVGNIIGAWWAYVELGWGGYWAWDAVENAGLMPWLVGTAFLHSIMMQRRRGVFRAWNMVLIVLTFNLAVFGTFLTRSGVLSSVHTFGDSTLMPFFMVFLGITFIGPLVLIYRRQKDLKDEAGNESLLSRESTFLVNNFLLVLVTAAIFLGTMFPLISGLFLGTKVEAGEGYFNQVTAPLFLLIILLAGICTLVGWRGLSLKGLLSRFTWPLAATVVVVAVLFFLGVRQWIAVTAALLCGLVFFTVILEWSRQVNARHTTAAENHVKAFWRLLRNNRPRYGAYLVHLAIILMAIGVTGSSVYGMETAASLKPGESVTVQNYVLTYDGIRTDQTPTRLTVTADVSLSNSGEPKGTLQPEKYVDQNYEQPVSEVAIHSTPIEDLYVILSGVDEDGTAVFDVMIYPLVMWMWIGGGVFLAGGLLAFWPGRERQRAPEASGTARTAAAGTNDEIERQVRELRRKSRRSCPHCGAGYDEGSRFCSRCGRSLEG